MEVPVTSSGRRSLLFLAAAVLVGGVVALIAVPASRPAATPAVTNTAPVAAATKPERSASPEVVAPVVGTLTPRREVQATPAPAARVAPASLEDVVSAVVPAVVSIRAGNSRGTGFYFKPGYVLTNVHVIDGSSGVEVHDGQTKRTAHVVNTSRGADLAVVQVHNADPNQPTLTLGTAASLRVGQEVIAVGSALGVLSNTVTRGIVSAVRRAGDVTLIQTDAAINPGNSGGPLVDRSGQVIGVNTLKIARAAESIGFAVAIDHASALLTSNGSVTTSAPPPVSGLNDMLRGNPSDGDHQRRRGEQQYAAMLEWAVRNADQIDTYWERYSKTCVTNARRSGDRPWFAVYEPNGISITFHSAYDCEQFMDTLRTNAGRVKAEMDKAADEARRSGVYPGVLRDMRRRHRLDWTGFDR